MTTKDMNFYLGRFIIEARKQDGTPYHPARYILFHVVYFVIWGTDAFTTIIFFLKLQYFFQPVIRWNFVCLYGYLFYLFILK